MTVVRLTKEEQFKLNLSEKLIFFYRKHPCEAARDLLGVKLTWFQRKILKDLWFKKNNLILMSRGIGKSWMLALFAILYAMIYPNVDIGVITPSYKQTEFLFDKITDFFEKSPYFRASVRKYSRTTYKAIVSFYNTSMIEGLPLGTGEKVRGRRYNVVLIDEYAFVDENIIKTVIRPMLNVKKPNVENKYIISSTAYYTWNHFYLQYLLYSVMSQKRPEQFGIHEYTFEDLKMVPDPPFELDDDIYEMMRMDTTEEVYSMENKCKFPIENVGFFSARLIDQCTPRATETQLPCPIEIIGEPKCCYSMGIDAARVAGGDNFSISIMKIENGIKKFVHGFVLNGSPYQEMIYNIRRLTQDFNIVQINCDSGGGGTTIKDLLMQPYKTINGLTLKPILDMEDKNMVGRDGIFMLRMVNFTRPVVNDLYMRLKADMQHRNINFPIDIRAHSDKDLEKVSREILETKRELLVLQHENKGNYYVFDSPSQFKKDRATSLALANQAANDFMSVANNSDIIELADGFWVTSI